MVNHIIRKVHTFLVDHLTGTREFEQDLTERCRPDFHKSKYRFRYEHETRVFQVQNLCYDFKSSKNKFLLNKFQKHFCWILELIVLQKLKFRQKNPYQKRSEFKIRTVNSKFYHSSFKVSLDSYWAHFPCWALFILWKINFTLDYG